MTPTRFKPSQMVRADLLLVHAGEMATLRGPRRPRRGRELHELGLVSDGALAVRGGRILAVGTTQQIRTKYEAPTVLDAEGSAVVPGFVDPHTHLPFAGTRGFELEWKLAGKSYLEILRDGGGIHYTVERTREATLSELVRLMRDRLATMLAWGTTTAEAKSGYGLTPADEIKQLQAVKLAAAQQPVDLVPTFLGAHVVPREHERDRQTYLREILRDMLPRIAKHQLAEYCDAFLEEGAFTVEECRRILTAARRLGLGTKLHADEFTNRKGAELASRLHCTSTEHLLKVSSAGIRALARSKTISVLLPGVSVTGFLRDFAPGRALIDAGAAVALGTDFNPNCHVLSMPTVLQWAVYHLRLHPAEALVAATINAAYAIGRADRVGSLEVGKSADFLVLEQETITDLAYRIGENPVRSVAKAGEVYTVAHGASRLRSQPRQ